MTDDIFFEKLKSKLENLELPYEPETWAALEQRLDGQQNPAEYLVHPIDVAAQEHLSDLEMPFDASTWARLEQHLDAIDNPVHIAPVDKIVAQKLQHLEPAFEPEHWHLMEQKLDIEQARRRRMLFAKFAEVAIFLLLLWNLADLIPGGNRNNFQKIYSQPTTASVDNQNVTSKIVSGTSSKNVQSDSKNISLDNGAHNFFYGTDASTITSIYCDEKSFEVFEDNSILPSKGQSSQTFSSVEKLPNLATESVVFIKKIAPIPQKVVVTNRKEKHYFVSNYAGIGRRNIETNDPNQPSLTQKHQSYSWTAGVAVGRRSKNWGIETGLQFSTGKYQPRRKIEIFDNNPQTGFTGIYLSEVDVQSLAVPVQVSRKLLKVGKTEVRGTIGMTAQFAVKKKENYQFIPVPTILGSNLPPFSQPKVSQGLFDGGNLADNTWLTSDFGIRAELPLGNRSKIFLATAAELPVAGRLQPRNAKVSQLAISAGVMTKI